ncbi:hypothetical protein C1I98_15520 [Spongiactinospora gelatinilytica]|uniref:Uncharacterized protein n=1 Tax=Spongiactinospora gelatinilytica TaxID=2666298 RepID=A0A2W2GAR9_9ACTN|nr:hypothetical protein C1I98_15520 [Spongiactinospora gelatinilytica]
MRIGWTTSLRGRSMPVTSVAEVAGRPAGLGPAVARGPGSSASTAPVAAKSSTNARATTGRGGVPGSRSLITVLSLRRATVAACARAATLCTRVEG